jgi:hypothetical protein
VTFKCANIDWERVLHQTMQYFTFGVILLLFADG